MAEINSQSYSTVVGYFSSQADAEDALEALRASGFASSQIGIAGYMESDATLMSETEMPARRKKPGFWERLFGGGTSAETTTTDELELNPVAETESSSYDDFHSTLTGLELPEDRSRYFSHQLGRGEGGLLVTVNAGTRRAEAEQVLRSAGADLGENIASWTPDQTAAIRPENQRIELYGEVLRVHRDRISRGEVRLRKETVTETKSVNVPVSHEELVIERTPVEGRPAPGAEIGRNSEIRIPLSEERVTVEKKPVVVEEVQAGKREVTNVETREEKVRREELKVEGDKAAEAERLRKAS